MKIKCIWCDEPAVVMIDAKNGGKNFYCLEHYNKKKKQNEKEDNTKTSLNISK